MLRQVINWILIACLAVGIYKAFGGDIGGFISATGDIVINIVDAGSDIVLQIWNAIFG